MKTFFLKTILLLVFLVTFNAIFFLLCGTDNKLSVWISYAFIHISYLTILGVPLIGSKGRDAFYLNAVLYSTAMSYFFIELIVGCICIAWAPDEIVWPLLIQALIWIVYTVILIGNAWANEATKQSLERREQALQPHRDMVIEMKKTALLISNPQVKKKAMALCDTLSYSGTRQTADTEQIDYKILSLIDALKVCVSQGEETSDEANRRLNELQALITERKLTLKYSH